MSINTVAILSPGDMGHAVGGALRQHGLRVVTCLKDRSQRTSGLAQKASIEDLPRLEEVVTQSDIILSVMVPAEAVNLARQVAAALKATGARPYYADCNAISPQTTMKVAEIITDAGGRFIDAGIIGSPPGKAPEPPRFYVSGPHAPAMLELHGKGIDVRVMGDKVGQASAIKMCYAAMTKGTTALWIALLTAAEVMGISEELRQEMLHSQANLYRRAETAIPEIPVKAYRWVGEMEEIAATFEHAGVTPHFHQGAAEIYRMVSETPFAQETPETLDTSRTLEESIAVFSQHVLDTPT